MQRFVLRRVHLDELGVDAVSRRPVKVELSLYAVLVHADPFSVECRTVGGGYFPVIRRYKEIVFLDAHGIVREQHGLCTFFGIRDIAHQIYPAVYQHLEKIRPTPIDVFISPAGICGNFQLVFIGITGATAKLVDGIV